MKVKHTRNPGKRRSAPLWVWILIILLVVAMPLFFSLVRNAQIQQALRSTVPTSGNIQAAHSHQNDGE